MKKSVAIALSTLMLIGSLTGCAPKAADQPAPAGDAPKADAPKTEAPSSNAPTTLKFMLNSPELTDQYNEMAEAYNKEHPNVTIEMDILQNDYQTVLKTKLNSGDIPDLFMSSAYNDNIVYKDYEYTLNDEPFMKNFDQSILNSVMLDGNITGIPFLVQAHSFIYNKDLFTKAGITTLPVTLDDYKAACEKLKAASIQPFSSGFAEWWVLPQTTYPSMSDANGGDYAKLFTDIKAGSAKFGELPQVDFALDLIDVIKANSGSKPMESTFDMQCSDFATGKVAMIHQGTWAESSIRSIKPEINIGFLTAPRADGKSVVAVESNLTFRVYKDSTNLSEVLKWADWITSSDYGKAWIPQKIQQISPLTGVTAPDTQLAVDTAAYLAKGESCPWWIFGGPDGIEQPFGTAIQNYASGTSDRAQTKAALTKVFADAFNAQ